MKSPHFSIVFFNFVAILLSPTTTTSASADEKFLDCLISSLHLDDASSVANVIYTRNNSSYSSILESSIQNLRFSTRDTPKPLIIITPLRISHIQSTIHCSRKYQLQIRIRSGGHDYEGLSYTSKVPFLVIDLINFRSVDVDVENKVAWVQSGAILGELYYRIAEKSKTLAFPAGICHTVGVGGYFSGGGYGLLFRKYGLAVDNIIDAQFIDVNSTFLDRKSMGEDLFWAIRGGGGGSFGIVVAWKLKLVDVPAIVTVSTITKTLEENATKLINRWQYVAPKFPGDVFTTMFVTRVASSDGGKGTILPIFTSLFLGNIDEFVAIMRDRFPELELTTKDCTEMSWIDSIMYYGQIRNESLDILLDRSYKSSSLAPFFKTKSDYVKEPIPESALDEIWWKFFETEAEFVSIGFVAYGGKMDKISEIATPFPHRAGNLYKIVYSVGWRREDNNKSKEYINWIRRVYDHMTPFVSKSPRETYVNYRDLDIGINTNIEGNNRYFEASIWGRKYFKNNFQKLVYVKTMIDPDNFFNHEQSIPPLFK